MTKPQESAWVSLGAAAAHLGSTSEALRKMFERRAKKAADGVVEAEVDGVRGRKLGKSWRVRLSAAWLGPAGAPVRPALGRGSDRSARRAPGSEGTDDGREDGEAAGQAPADH